MQRRFIGTNHLVAWGPARGLVVANRFLLDRARGLFPASPGRCFGKKWRMARSSAEEPLAGFVCSRRPLTVSPRSQQRTDVELRLLEGGSITLLIGGRVQWLPARRLSVYWAGMPHQVLAHEGRENWLMRIPLAWLLARGLPANFINGLLEGRVFFEPDVDDFECDRFRMHLWSGDVG